MPDRDAPLYMDAVITRHRSLSQRGFIILMAVMTTINIACAAVFVAMGAAPVPVFLGLDLGAVALAFALSNRAAARRERVQVSAEEVRVLSETPRGTAMLWRSPTAFTRVDLTGEAENAGDLALRLSDRRLAIAAALSRPERLAFAAALEGAIARARSGRG